MNGKMNIIITMAGNGTRFKEAGYKEPKYMIKVNGKTLFEWSMDSLLDYNKYVEKYIFVVQKADNSKQFIEKQCKNYNINNFYILEIEEATDGQATTCMLAMPYCREDIAILVYNIDTYVEPGQMKFKDIKGDGYIPCFYGIGNHWSFVKTDEEGKVIEVREKERISNNCTIGAYYFSSSKLYKEIYNKYYFNNKNLEKNEKYIAPLYNYMIQNNMEVRISIIDDKKVHVLGTPEELKNFENLY